MKYIEYAHFLIGFICGFLVAIVIMSQPAHAETCTIVTTESVGVYYHEIAHCNGWVHEFGARVSPPQEYLRPYTSGTLRVVITEGDGYPMGILEPYVQRNAIIEYSMTHPMTWCVALWNEREIFIPPLSADQTVYGCSIIDK